MLLLLQQRNELVRGCGGDNMFFFTLYFTFLHLLFQFCWGYSGYLVEIEDHTEDRALDEFLGKFDCFWIGLHDEAVEGLCLVGPLVARSKTIQYI